MTNRFATVQPLPEQLAICSKFQVAPEPLLLDDRLGIALKTLNLRPINGLRIPDLSGSCGWYIYEGSEPTDAPDFYQSLCVTHLNRCCEIAIPYLCLPRRWRFQIDTDGYEDVWRDEDLLKRQ